MLLLALSGLLPLARAQMASILSAEFAVEGSPVNPPPCTDTADLDDDVRDFLPVTFSHPVDGETLAVGDFEVVLGTIDGTAQETVTPGCATLAPALEADEMQTVLLVGDFTPAGSPALGPVTVNVVGDLNVLVEGAPENVNGLNFSAPSGSFLFKEIGPRILTAELLPAGEACAATAEADARARLIFGSGVRENVVGDTGNFAVLGNGTKGGEAAAERAAGMFETPLGEVLSIQDVDPDNVVDVCMKMAPDAGMAGDATITMTCEDAQPGGPDFVVRDPEGEACEAQTADLDMTGFMVAPAPAPAPAPMPEPMAAEPPVGGAAIAAPVDAAMGPEADMPAGSGEAAEPDSAGGAGVSALAAAGAAVAVLALVMA